MKKGISPIVAVVLLIAIAVISAVGLYYWVGGLATKQPTPNTPNVITAIKTTAPVCPDANNTQVAGALIQNLGTTSITLFKGNTEAFYYLKTSVPHLYCIFGLEGYGSPPTEISPGEQKICGLNFIYILDGTSSMLKGVRNYSGTISIFGNNTGSVAITLDNETVGNYTIYVSNGGGGGNGNVL